MLQRDHMRRMHGEKRYTCSECQQGFSEKLFLLRHIAKKHGPADNIVCCRLCPYVSTSLPLYHTHLQRMHFMGGSKDKGKQTATTTDHTQIQHVAPDVVKSDLNEIERFWNKNKNQSPEYTSEAGLYDEHDGAYESDVLIVPDLDALTASYNLVEQTAETMNAQVVEIIQVVEEATDESMSRIETTATESSNTSSEAMSYEGHAKSGDPYSQSQLTLHFRNKMDLYNESVGHVGTYSTPQIDSSRNYDGAEHEAEVFVFEEEAIEVVEEEQESSVDCQIDSKLSDADISIPPQAHSATPIPVYQQSGQQICSEISSGQVTYRHQATISSIPQHEDQNIQSANNQQTIISHAMTSLQKVPSEILNDPSLSKLVLGEGMSYIHITDPAPVTKHSQN